MRVNDLSRRIFSRTRSIAKISKRTSSMLSKFSFVNGFGSTSFMPAVAEQGQSVPPRNYLEVHSASRLRSSKSTERLQGSREPRLTVREVSHDVVRTRVAGHRDDGRHRVELADQRRRRDACKFGARYTISPKILHGLMQEVHSIKREELAVKVGHHDVLSPKKSPHRVN